MPDAAGYKKMFGYFQRGLFFLVCLATFAAVLSGAMFIVGSLSLFTDANLDMLNGWLHLAAASELTLAFLYFCSIIAGIFFKIKPSLPAFLLSIVASAVCLAMLYVFSALNFVLGGLEQLS